MLGPLLITGPAGQPVVVARPQQRTVLHVLLARAGAAVPPDTLAGALWGPAAGRRAPGALRVLVHHLRRVLGADRIVREPGGFVLRVADGELDAHEFLALLDEAGGGEPERARGLLRRALGLWRGAAFQDDDSGDPVRAVAARLTERRLTAYEDLFDLELRRGAYRQVCAETLAVVREHPLREQLVAQAMTALAGSERTAEALQLYERTRLLLAEELGTDPGARLRDLYAELLAPSRTHLGMPATDVPPERDPHTGCRIVPAQLPPSTAHFTARGAEVARLSARLRAAGAGPVRCGVAGMGGIGKTALAVEASRRVAAAFPDGQLFVDLRGGEPEPADPGRVLGAFLRALGVASSAVPAGAEERAALFRSRVADLRILVVLDNAAGEAQVHPLLPAGPGCAVLITSRARMTALDGVDWTDLGLLDPADGARLLHAVAGRGTDEPAATAEVVDLCGRLPLAIRIAGARVLGRPHWDVARLADALRDERGRLDELTVGDLAVRGSLRLSYQALPDDAARLLRRLGLLGGDDLNAWVAATLLDTPIAEAERLLDLLVDAQLVRITGAGPGSHLRYGLHDLVRLYARERADAEESTAGREAALARTWTTLADIATEADRRAPLRVLTAVAAVTGAAPPDEPWIDALLADPAAWYDAERNRLIEGAHTASGEAAWRIPAASMLEFQTRGLFRDWRDTHRLGLRAAVAAGDLTARALMHRNLAQLEIFGGDGDWQRGATEAQAALELFRHAGIPLGEADALLLLSAAALRQGDLGTALPPAREGLRIARAAGDRRAEANLLHQVGWIHRMSGDLDTARERLGEGLRLAGDGGFTRLLIWLSIAVGIVHRDRDDLVAADHHLRQALTAAREARLDGDTASILTHLAALRRRRGDPAGARATAEESLRLCRAVGLVFNEAQTLITLGEIAIDLGDGTHAHGLLTAGRDRMERLSSVHGRAQAWRALGDAESLRGRPDAARDARVEARRLFHRAGDAAAAGALDSLLTGPPGTDDARGPQDPGHTVPEDGRGTRHSDPDEYRTRHAPG
ncbi:AfsR/SARP family transcriptional regulator [Catenuloplanes indicus]|uniref:DNA-binding SARP family transcriptional activator/tetratricopeptide (TPR) repeat protein n=1 Tax=Catenuloplanes indicus TaxID=137267 RepID=A0AAE3VXD9_9ACTN|nr:BTAD domain-containing putative transcriptional regulator [Catenuloplanes indicus]MDQ0364979.1 DNA-binding SARP family transcriptional activator/tetratricopeptide (TPR) repeat protein [Catenuloplanes indicus]